MRFHSYVVDNATFVFPVSVNPDRSFGDPIMSRHKDGEILSLFLLDDHLFQAFPELEAMNTVDDKGVRDSIDLGLKLGIVQS